jgi:hypothetical protein
MNPAASEPGETPAPVVVRCRDSDYGELQRLVARYGLRLRAVGEGQAIPGSFWGDEEAGLLGEQLLVRADTPLHSLLHEACHYVCMDSARRAGLDTNAGGDYDEENAVCYLSILLADEVPGFGREQMMADMDAWGYSFRLGSARAWFESDAEDAREWLRRHRLITGSCKPAFRKRAE